MAATAWRYPFALLAFLAVAFVVPPNLVAEDADTLNQRGVAAYDAGRFEEAHALFAAAWQKSHRAAILYNLGRCQQKLGQFSAARETFARLLARADLLKGPHAPYRKKAEAALAEVVAAIDANKPPEVAMVAIPAGPVPHPDGGAALQLPAFAIDVFEVTQLHFGFCVRAGACAPLPPEAAADTPQSPVRRVTWEQAQAYCQYAGKRLPTELEWERAAAGQGANPYPWGTATDPARATLLESGASAPTPPGSAAGDRSADGVHDLGGNVAEWVADWFTDVRPGFLTGPTRGVKRVVRGGSFRTPLKAARTDARFGLLPNRPRDDVGFRCARSAP